MGDEVDPETSESHFLTIGPPVLHAAQVRPRSADVSLAPPAASTSASALSASKLVRGATHDGTSMQLVCPSCGEQPAAADSESAFHAHVTRCFITQHAGRPPRTPQASPLSVTSDGVGPIRKTRVRASSAAAATGPAAELASALAAAGPHAATTPESHGYHPYGSGPQQLSSTLRQLRRTVDQLDLHARISIMEAFNKLSRVAMVEQQAAATQAMMGAPSPRGKRLRSLTNSPSPKHKPIEENVKDILSLLYSPRLTAPHPSPNHAAPLHRGLPSPLVIGIASHAAQQLTPNGSTLTHEQLPLQRQRSAAEVEAAAAANNYLVPPPPSIMSSPVSQMDTLELEPGYHAHGAQTPMKSTFFYAQQQQPSTPPQQSGAYSRGRGADSVSIESAVSSPVAMSTDVDGSESDAAACSALSLTGAFVHAAISSGASSPASTPSGASEQTSPSGDANSLPLDRALHGSRVFPAHCFPDKVPDAQQQQQATSDSPGGSGGRATPSRLDGTCGDGYPDKQRMMRHNTATARG